ncbi:GNAT family N-acetyltransferase [Alkalicoccus daliensis]|uniref:Acetyltransferase (GNAT) family protein n=1 Tax=Alkalicoccus daliensis TaxID=745820 RepID=A0A1H0CWV0_9BACI|nr:GNAT family N-acetyltransferase [Alkalicoccus daliensis]SDN62390.1 Acetyltransferase (GNAT) family protein [Alkalicoccus daliensis]
MPEGLNTQNNYLFDVYAGEQLVGMIWLARKDDKNGFIYDLLIFEKYRNLGYGKAVMQSIEWIAKELGVLKLGLQVFPHNEHAVHLYHSSGFQVTNMKMEKRFSDDFQIISGTCKVNRNCFS